MLKPQENVTEHPTVLGLRQLAVAGVELTPDERQVHIQKWMLRAGLTILEDSDVIDMGDYVTPREVLGATSYIVNNGTYLTYVEFYSAHDAFSSMNVKAAIARNTTIYLGEKPLRLTGVYEYTMYGDQRQLLNLRSMEGAQVEILFRAGTGNRPTNVQNVMLVITTPSGIKPVDRSALSAKDRKSIALGIKTLLSHTLRDKYPVLLDNLERNSRAVEYAMVGNDIVYRTNRIHKWGGYINSARVRAVRQEITKPLGELLKRSMAGDLDYHDVADDVVDLFDSGLLSQDQTHYLVGRWNAICDSSDEVIRGRCGHVFHHGDGNSVRGGDEHVCNDCFSEDYVWVEGRDEYWHRDDAYYHESSDAYYSYPEDEDEDEDEASGLSSWGSSTEYLKHDKSFKPSPTGDFTMGIELEVEATESRKKRVGECADYFNTSYKYAMFKSDGSLDSELGFEIVTAARRLCDHVKMFKDWQPEKLVSWDAGNCGMHVHIDSRAFTPLTLGKFLMFFNSPDNAQFIRDIAGRHPKFDNQAQNYAATIDSRYVNNPERVKKSSYDNESRYRMVNVTNLTHSEQERLGMRVERQSKGDYSTIEVRIFRGTLRKDRLLAHIEFAHAAVAFCRAASWQEMDGDAFKHWLSVTEGYPHLRRWYGVSRARNKNNTEAAQEAEVEEI